MIGVVPTVLRMVVDAEKNLEGEGDYKELLKQQNLRLVVVLSAGSKKQKSKLPEEGESSRLHPLATAAVLGDNVLDFVESASGVITRHPRHCPGCIFGEKRELICVH